MESKEETTGRAGEQGQRLEDIYVTQPPILEMQALVEEVTPTEIKTDRDKDKETDRQTDRHS